MNSFQLAPMVRCSLQGVVTHRWSNPQEYTAEEGVESDQGRRHATLSKVIPLEKYDSDEVRASQLA